MRLFVIAAVFCFAHPAMPELPPFHKLSGAVPEQVLLTRDEVHALIADAAQKNNLPPEFVKSIVAAESDFQSNAVSPKGAVGLMQVMPETAEEMGLDASIPVQNVEAGTKYLASLVKRYQKKT